MNHLKYFSLDLNLISFYLQIFQLETLENLQIHLVLIQRLRHFPLKQKIIENFPLKIINST